MRDQTAFFYCSTEEISSLSSNRYHNKKYAILFLMKRKLLVVEDDLFLNKVYQEKLTREGYEVKTAEDGEAVDAILKKFTPDLIILDLVMPNKDGFAVLKELKAKSTTKNIPILVTTNLGEAENRDMCLKMGATDYFVKADTSLARLTEKIGKLLQ